MNNKYRVADYERWQQLEFVIGVEIHRSKTAKCSCVICDNMKGVYPKTFKFQGWHDECKCFLVPIMLEGEDFTDYLLIGGVSEHLKVKTIPAKALQYMKNNHDKLKEYYWFEELLKLNKIYPHG